MSSKPTVIVLGDFYSGARARVKQLEPIADFVFCNPASRDEFIQDLKTKYTNARVLCTTFQVGHRIGGVNKELIDHFPPSLKFVCHNGAGYDIIDVDALTAKGIQVSHTPDAVVAATADTAIYLILGTLRNFGRLERDLRAGDWCKKTPLAHDPQGKVLGILGLGGIGKSVRDKCFALGFPEIIYHNRTRLPADQEKGAEYVAFDQLLSRSDVICLGIPLNENTRHSINAETLSKCKKGVIIVNIARGAIIDENALVEALESGQVSNVGLDVYEHEPKIHPGLLKHPNAILLPHVGTHSIESRTNMDLQVLDNVESALKDGKMRAYVVEQRQIKWD